MVIRKPALQLFTSGDSMVVLRRGLSSGALIFFSITHQVLFLACFPSFILHFILLYIHLLLLNMHAMQ